MSTTSRSRQHGRSGSRRSSSTRFGDELDAIRQRVIADRGERDADYIRRVIKAQRGLEVAGRGLLCAGFFPPAWLAGTAALSLSKILDNMEIGHNVMHGQYDWMNDPKLSGKGSSGTPPAPATSGATPTTTCTTPTPTSSARTATSATASCACPRTSSGTPTTWATRSTRRCSRRSSSTAWRCTTSRSSGSRPARPTLRRQARDARGRSGARSAARRSRTTSSSRRSPGPCFPFTLAGNATANLVRNVWSFTIIFCGHFPDGTHEFTEEETEDETRGQWYYRQLLGSANLTGGRLFHIMSGNLSHQIEHHLFPDLPANRYAEISVEVREICERYGIPYNAGPLRKQFGSVVRKICRLALPDRGRSSKSAPLPHEIGAGLPG